MGNYVTNGGYFLIDSQGVLASPNTGPHTCSYISATFNGGEHAEIDVTTTSFGSSSPGRKYSKGLGAGRTIEIECFLDLHETDPEDPKLIDTQLLNALKDYCGDVQIKWGYSQACDSAITEYVFVGSLYDFNIEGDLDSAMKVSMSWRLIKT